MAKSWYAFVSGDDATDVKNYIKVHGGRFNCLCGFKICVVYASGVGENGTHPTDPFSSNLQLYIKNALATGQLQPEVPISSKKYVYLRDY